MEDGTNSGGAGDVVRQDGEAVFSGDNAEAQFIWQVEGWVSTLVQPFRSGFIAQSHDSIYDPHETSTHATHQADFSYFHV